MVKKQYNKYAILAYQKYLLEKHYSFLRCSIHYNKLICTGKIQPQDCNEYEVRIEYDLKTSPNVFIKNPVVTPTPQIHMYKDSSLCLFYPPDFKWQYNTNIAQYIVPWLVEWIIFYEIWLITGKWEGKEAPHNI